MSIGAVRLEKIALFVYNFCCQTNKNFLQNGTSARLVAPLILMPAPEYVGRHALGGKQSSPRSLPLGRKPDGMKQEPYESQLGRWLRITG